MNHFQLSHSEASQKMLPLKHKSPIIFILDGITDPVNIGGFYRLADAINAQEVCCCGTSMTQDEWRKIKKVARATDKNIDHPVCPSTLEVIHSLQKAVQLIVVDITNLSQSYHTFSYPKNQPIAFIFWSEKHGVSQEVLEIVQSAIHVPMLGENSSMNVVQSASIVSYHALQKLGMIE